MGTSMVKPRTSRCEFEASVYQDADTLDCACPVVVWDAMPLRGARDLVLMLCHYGEYWIVKL